MTEWGDIPTTSDLAGVAIPPGTMLGWPVNAAAPAGFMLADGTALTTGGGRDTLRSALLSAGSPYGTSGADPRLPNLTDRSPLARAASGTGSTLGGTGGAASPGHSHNASGGTLALSSHFHTSAYTVSAHSHPHALTESHIHWSNMSSAWIYGIVNNWNIVNDTWTGGSLGGGGVGGSLDNAGGGSISGYLDYQVAAISSGATSTDEAGWLATNWIVKL